MKFQNLFKQFSGEPINYEFPKTFEYNKTCHCDGFDCEYYLQSNGIRPDGTITYQKVIMTVPTGKKDKLPAVVVPFYYPEAALGFDPATGEELPSYIENPVMTKLVRRGFVAISAQSYHLTYAEYNKEKTCQGNVDFDRWAYIGSVFNSEHPEWSGVGKLVADTRLLIDVLENDERVDKDRIGIMGHSLGGKMAFYTGCTDERIKVIVSSDFGLLWDSTNWSDPWYWGDKLQAVRDSGLTNELLLNDVAQKPFCLIAGETDNDKSRELLYGLSAYENYPERILVVDHRSGHRPPAYALDAGIGFMEHWLG